jgi:hypothetical protein
VFYIIDVDGQSVFRDLRGFAALTKPETGLIFIKSVLKGANMDVYICVYCGWPIIFRYPWHQIFHIPTGWHCWESQKGKTSSLCCFKFKTPKETREKDRKKFENIFEKNEPEENTKPPMRFIKNIWKQKKEDVIHDILGFLARNGSSYANDLIKKIVTSPEWDRYYNIRKKHPVPR